MHFDNPWTKKGEPTVHFNGTSLVGSPLARSRSPAYLRANRIETHQDHFDDDMLSHIASDGTLELFRILGLLDASGKMPHVTNFQASSDIDPCAGISPCFFHLAGQPRMVFYDLARNLRGLRLDFTTDTCKPDEQPPLDLHRLKKYLETAYSLESMSLNFQQPYGYFEDRQLETLYHFALVVPQSSAWCLPNLQRLRLAGLRVSYSEIARLLFLNLPKLGYLEVSRFQLTDGHWEDIIEGLCKLPTLTDCYFDPGTLLCPSGYSLSFVWAVSDTQWEDGDDSFPQLVKKYISNGGRHPCLARDAPDSASSKYMLRLDETLRILRTANP
ncbi:MAG: hypothetical protein Q9223_000258 [Gallowayella weberi]